MIQYVNYIQLLISTSDDPPPKKWLQRTVPLQEKPRARSGRSKKVPSGGPGAPVGDEIDENTRDKKLQDGAPVR